MADSANGHIQSITRHPEYYIQGGDLSILVEHTQFRVHRYFFERESTWFKDQLVQPASPGSSPQGSSDANSFILDSLTPTQFARFLWVFYNPRHSIYETTLEDWESILRLSERWKFPEVKSLSIRELEKIDITDVKRIKLYHENNVDRNLLISRYAALCEREEPLTLSEGLDLGMETTLQIASAREQARAARLPSGQRSPSTPTVHGEDLRDIIRELFRIDATPVTAPVNTQNSGALKPTPKQEPEKNPPPPTKKPTENQKNPAQNQKKGKAKTELPMKMTTTPPKETKPPSPVETHPTTTEKTTTKMEEEENKGGDTNDGPSTEPQEVVVPVASPIVDSGSTSAELNPADGVSTNTENTSAIAVSLFDPLSDPLKITTPSSVFGSSVFGGTSPFSWN